MFRRTRNKERIVEYRAGQQRIPGAAMQSGHGHARLIRYLQALRRKCGVWGFLSHARLGAGTVQRLDRAEPIISLSSVVSFQGVENAIHRYLGDARSCAASL